MSPRHTMFPWTVPRITISVSDDTSPSIRRPSPKTFRSLSWGFSPEESVGRIAEEGVTAVSSRTGAASREISSRRANRLNEFIRFRSFPKAFPLSGNGNSAHPRVPIQLISLSIILSCFPASVPQPGRIHPPIGRIHTAKVIIRAQKSNVTMTESACWIGNRATDRSRPGLS